MTPTQAQIEAAAQAIFAYEKEEGLTIAPVPGPHIYAMATAALTAAAQVGDTFEDRLRKSQQLSVEQTEREESIIDATIEHCAQVAMEYMLSHQSFTYEELVAAIRALKD